MSGCATTGGKMATILDTIWLAIAKLGDGTAEDGGFLTLLSRQFYTDYDCVF
jgi:hypothetical protein